MARKPDPTKLGHRAHAPGVAGLESALRDGRLARALSSAGRPLDALGRALDFASDWALLAFAAWTLLAYLGMTADVRVDVLVPIWIASSAALGLVLHLLLRRGSVDAPGADDVDAKARLLGRDRGRLLLAAALGTGGAFAILVGLDTGVPWPVLWVLAVASLALAVVATSAFSGPRAATEHRVPRSSSVVAALTALGLAAISFFLNRPSADDVFYVNRAVATAELDRIPVRDVLVTHEQVAPASGAGLPVDSFSALQGALGRLVDVHPASIAYYLTPALFTFLATWALWRLLRSWTARWALVCFALGCAFWLLSAQDNLTPGSFFVTRMWQGKVVFVAWLVPTLYVHLTRWLGGRDTSTALLLLAAGVASIGLTASATFAAPLVFGTAALALLVRREWRGLPVVVLAAAVPFAIGFAATRIYPLDEALGGPEQGPAWYFQSYFGWGLVAAVGALALLAAPWLARPGPGRWLTTGIAGVTLLLLTPGLLGFMQEMTGVQGALRRTMWVVPLPALVGLLGSVRLVAVPRVRALAALPAAVVLGLLAAFGNPLWDSESGQVSWWTRTPAWKVREAPLAAAKEMLKRYDGEGPVLASAPVMSLIALLTSDPKAVNPRRWYVLITGEPDSRKADRIALTAFVEGRRFRPSLPEARAALADLRVGLVCADPSMRRVIQDSGPYELAFSAGGALCLKAEAR